MSISAMLIEDATPGKRVKINGVDDLTIFSEIGIHVGLDAIIVKPTESRLVTIITKNDKVLSLPPKNLDLVE